MSAALILAGCGAAGNSPPTVPVTFTTTTPTPTSAAATPTSRPTIGPNGLPSETGPFLASATTTALGAIVDGIQCQPLAQLAYTAYAHLQVYVEGRSQALPGGIGLVNQNPQTTTTGLFYGATACMYWLHTRASDGLIEVQSPVNRRYTLGDFFEIWKQPLSSQRVADQHGAVTALVNGRRWRGDPATIPLTEHANIELAVGKPVPEAKPVVWAGTDF